MYDQMRNIKPIDCLNSKVHENSKFYSKITIRAVLFREKESVYLCMAHVGFLHRDDAAPKDIMHDYGGVILAEYTLDTNEWSRLLNSIESTSIDMMSIKDVKFQGSFNQDCYHISSRTKYAGVYNDWPFWYVMCSANQNVHFMGSNDLLASPGKPAYQNFYDAAKSFLKLDGGFNMNTPIGIYFKVPDYKARIKILEIAEKHVTVTVETRESKLGDLIVQLYCKKGKDSFHPDSDLFLDSNGMASLSLPFIPDFVDTILLEKKSGDKIDSKTFGDWQQNDGVVIKTSRESVETMLASKENQTVEFKQNIDNKNQSEFLESISAFANTNDGTILLGIDDEGNLIGIHDDFDKIEKRIKGLVNSLCEPTVEISIEEMTIDNRMIVVIKVKEGTDKPYLVKDRNAFKRVDDHDIQFKRIDFDRVYGPKYSQQRIGGLI